MHERYDTRYLDVGGLTTELNPVFYGLAIDDPTSFYCVADLRVGSISFGKEIMPVNLDLVKPETSKEKHPLLSLFPKYKLPFPDGFFNGARMDMVLDFLIDPFKRLKVIAEIKRTLRRDACLHIVDDDFHLPAVRRTAKLARFTITDMMTHQGLVVSGYLLSPQALSWVASGDQLFYLELTKL